MHSSDLAPSIDETVRQFVDLAIHEAIAATTDQLTAAIDTLRAQVNSLSDPAAIKSDVEHAVADTLSSALSGLVQRNVASLRSEIQDGLSALRDELAPLATDAAQLRQMIDALDVKISQWADHDRYTVTRAHVLKAMREIND